MARLNPTNLLNDIYFRVQNLESIPVFRPSPRNPLPEVLPDEFIVLWPLFNNVRQAWAERRYVTQRVQATCWAPHPARAWEIADLLEQALPASEFVIDGSGPEGTSGQHAGVPVTIRAIT